MKKKQKKHSEFYKKSYKKSKKAQKEDLEDLNSLLENESYKIGTFRRNERGFHRRRKRNRSSFRIPRRSDRKNHESGRVCR